MERSYYFFTHLSPTGRRQSEKGDVELLTGGREKPLCWHGRVFDFKSEEEVLPNGKHTSIEVIRHPGSSAIVPVQGDHFVLLLRQYRPAIRRFIWEIPAGTMRLGENPLDCAKRELQEECGVIGNCFENMGEILIAPGYSDERIHLFLASGFTPCEQRLDEDEYLEIHSLRFDETMEMIERGEIEDAMSIVGLKMAHSRLQRNDKQNTNPMQ